MRPHRLRVTAFGAFGGTIEVCFDDLASAGLFLLHGETGAGKTTLLDAIGFALYGRVPGERAKTRRLRSDHAAPGSFTEVELEATLGGRRMRVTRKPEQQRPKRRGGGTTTEQAKVLLEEHDGSSWRALSTRAGEADDEIKDLMGMSAEQFYQVVLLPQGEFAQFLHAAADKRAELLEKLFGTDRFGKVEDWLAERRRATARAVDAAEQAIRELTAVIAQVVGPDPAALTDPATARSATSRPAQCCPIPRCLPIPRCCPIPPGPRCWRRPPPPRPRSARPGFKPSALSLIRPRTASGPPSGWPTGSVGAPGPCALARSWLLPLPPSAPCAGSSLPPPAPPRRPERSARTNGLATPWPGLGLSTTWPGPGPSTIWPGLAPGIRSALMPWPPPASSGPPARSTRPSSAAWTPCVPTRTTRPMRMRTRKPLGWPPMS